MQLLRKIEHVIVAIQKRNGLGPGNPGNDHILGTDFDTLGQIAELRSRSGQLVQSRLERGRIVDEQHVGMIREQGQRIAGVLRRKR